MKGLLSNILIFTTGAALGSVVTWGLLRKRYEQLVKEDIASVEREFARRKKAEREADRAEFTDKLVECGYLQKDDMEGGDTSMRNDAPYVISPDQVGEMDGYDIETLVYHSNGVLTDIYDEPIDDVDDIVGRDSLTHFGDYDDDKDVVYVRNDNQKCDYEIQYDSSAYGDSEELSYPHDVEE